METHVSFTPQSLRSCFQAGTHIGKTASSAPQMTWCVTWWPSLHHSSERCTISLPSQLGSQGLPTAPREESSRQITHRKGFTEKREVSPQPIIQSHISNRGQTMWHIVYLGCKPLEKGLTLCHHKPMTRNHWSLYKILRASALPGALWKPERQPESPQGLPGLRISKHAPQLVWAQQAIKLQIICFTQIPSWKFKTKIEDVAPQLLKKVPATLRPHLLWSVPILRQHQATCSSISSATRFATWDKGFLKVRSSQSLTV